MFAEPPHIPPRRELIWAAVDLDGTLAEGIWTPDDPTSRIGPPIWENVRKVEHLVANGWKIHVHTARSWEDYEKIENWLNWHKIPWNNIHCGKLLAAVYVDDRAVRANDRDWTNGLGARNAKPQ